MREEIETEQGMSNPERLISHFGNLFDSNFYINLINRYPTFNGKDFTEYLAIIVGLREDDGQRLMDYQAKYLL